VQQENRSYRLTNRVALVTTLGLALLGTPAIAFGAENGVATTAETDSVAAIVQAQDASASAQPVSSQTANSTITDEGAPKDAPQTPADSNDNEPSSVPSTGNETTAGTEQQPTAENPGSSQQQEAQEEKTPEAGQTQTPTASSSAAEASSQVETTEASSSPQAATAEESVSAAATTSSVTTAEESISQLPMYRLYNRYNGEHLFTSSSSEAQNLIALGWTGESVAWFTPNSGNAVFRLYNRYSGDHHYTTSRDEYNSLVAIGWSGEGVGFYSDPAQTTMVYRLFNPYVTVATHHYTTAQSEYDYLGSIGWRKEGAGWYGAPMPTDGWYVTSSGDELLVSGGAVKSDAVVTNESGQSRYLTPAGFVAKGSTWVSPSNGNTYVTASDGTITQVIVPNAGESYCWLKSSPYWSGAGAVKELLMNVHYSTGRFGQSISKIVIHHNAGNLTTEGCYYTWQTRPASAHYQVEANGTVGQLVLDSNTAWHAGNWTINTQTIGIEHADYKDGNGQWRMTEATINSGARLVAALCLQYSLGRPQWGVNVVGHNECVSTECPASLAVGGSQHDEYITKAQEWYDKLSKI
jgi:uncharacterized membrane protein